MGGCCTGGPVPVDLPSIPQDIIQLSETTSPKIVNDLLEVMVKSFTGTTKVPGEPMLSWAFDPDGNVDGDPCNPLKEEPSAERLATMRFVIKYCYYHLLKYGCCFALMKNGSPVGGVFMCPPNSKGAHEESNCYFMWAMMNLGMTSSISSGNSAMRFDAMDKACKAAHKKCLDGKNDPHWFVNVVGMDSEYQGQGYGRELFNFILGCGDHTGHKMYLDTFGPRNKRFYEKNGFEVKDVSKVNSKKLELTVHGGGALGMLRAAKK
ncbi:hypothetical protein TrST_g13289 [Triparma strigata]|uniref:N-acetyltransferase domain-containing protein n=1 Tax=Triparma strigata TaxID=1606541 RepID=A0A9W7ENT6_9STRA|nr:hypothetical protein TrST_g13289 [Triparma strigata]